MAHQERRVEKFSHTGCDLGQHAAGFEGYARHSHKDTARTLEPHDRGSAEAVDYHTARRGHHGLSACERVHHQAALGENAVHILGRGCVVHHSAAENVAEQTLGDVVARGAEATGGKHKLAFGQRGLHGAADVGGIIAHGADAFHIPSGGRESAGDEARIGVGDASQQDFVADNYYG